MEGIFFDITKDFAFPYQDDEFFLRYFSNGPQAHTYSVSKTERRIKIKARKSSPSQKRVNYFERVISEKGYQIDQRDTKAATEPTHKKPRSTSNVSSLFDLLACYR